MWSSITAIRVTCLLNGHHPVRLISQPRYMMETHWVRISQCRYCGKAIFRYSGHKTIRWRSVRLRHKLTEKISTKEQSWMYVTGRFSNDTRWSLTPIERELIDPEKRRTWIADVLGNRS